MESNREFDETKSAMANILLDDLLKERRIERRWRLIRRVLLSLITLVMMIAIYTQQASLMGGNSPSSDVIGVINITGEIAPGKTASADRIIPLITKAFDDEKVKAVYLNINSQGGSPVESERINAFLDAKRQETQKPTYAVISSIGASAAYMIAVHTDKIYAGRYSLVGSIGAIMQGWDIHKAIESRDIYHRVYASGNLKGLMNPFTPMPDGGEDKAQNLVSQMGKEFAKEVSDRRADALKKAGDVNLFSGEVWNGTEALKLGLVDEIGTLDHIILKTHNMAIHDFGPSTSKASILGIEMESLLSNAITNAFKTIFSSGAAPVSFASSGVVVN